MVRSNSRTVVLIKAALLGTAMAAFAFYPAYADKPNNRPPDNRPPDRGDEIDVQQSQRQGQAQGQHQGQGQQQGQAQTSESYSESGANAGANAASSSASDAASASESSSSVHSSNAATVEGDFGAESSATGGTSDVAIGDTEVNIEGDRVENNSSNIVLVPNNNTAGCMRVWGLSFGKDGAAGGIGVPTRDKACDFEQAADDAAAMGEHKIAWWWRCHKPTLYKTFNGDSKAQKQLACWNSMVAMLGKPVASDIPDGSVLLAEEEYQDLLLAQVDPEKIEQLQDKLTQQQSLIEELQEDADEHDNELAELEALKREAARLRAKQETEQKEDAARRAAALEALKKIEARKKDDGDTK